MSLLIYGQIRRVAPWILRTGKLTIEPYEKIAKGFVMNPPWKAFIDNLSGNMIRISIGFSVY